MPFRSTKTGGLLAIRGLLTAALLAMPAWLFAQSYPPAQGPPPASGNNIWFFEARTFVTNPLENAIIGELNAMNAELAVRTDKRARLSLRSIEAWSPYVRQTENPDRPNHRYVNVPHMLTIDISDIQYDPTTLTCPPGSFVFVNGRWMECPASGQIVIWNTYPWDRTLSLSVDMNIFCNGWQSGTGDLTVVAAPGVPYLDPDPDGPVETAVDFFLGGWLVDHVNAQVRAVIPALADEIVQPGYSCNTLDAGPHPGVPADVFRFALVPTWAPGSTLDFMTIQPTRVKRLAAHTLEGTVLYDHVEDPLLDFWADFGRLNLHLPEMTEGQEVFLDEAPVTIRKPPSGNLLVIIANIGTTVRHTTFQTYSSGANFGSGRRKITVSKQAWTRPQPPRIPKPTPYWVPAYEITFEINVPDLQAEPPAPSSPVVTPPPRNVP